MPGKLVHTAVLAAAVLALAAVRAPGALPVHARLERSIPAADDTLRVALDSIRLEFSAQVTLGLTRLHLIAPAGDSLLLAAAAGDEAGLIIVAAAPPLAAGRHVLHWRTTSQDGHVLSGEIPFTVAESAAAPVAGISVRDTASWPIAGDAPVVGGDEPIDGVGAERDLSAILPLLRALGSAILLLLAGGLLYTARAPAQLVGLQRLLVALALVAPFAVLSELIAWTAHVSGGFELGLALQLPTGRALLARVILAAAALAVWVGLKRPSMAALVALIAVAAGSALGHAGAIAPLLSVPLRAVHLLAVAVWFGAIAALVSALRAQVAPSAFVRGVSRAALWSFIIVAVTGLAQAVVLLGDPVLLVASTYGRVVLVKATGLIALAAFGLYHRRLIDRLDAPGTADALRASATREIVLFIGIIVVSAALAFTPLPE